MMGCSTRIVWRCGSLQTRRLEVFQHLPHRKGSGEGGLHLRCSPMVCPKDLRSIGVSTTKNCPLLDLEPTKTSPCTLEIQHRRQVGDFGVSECGQSDESGAAKTTPRVVRGPQEKGRECHGNLGEKDRKPPEIYLTEYISFHVETNSMQELVYIVMSHICLIPSIAHWPFLLKVHVGLPGLVGVQSCPWPFLEFCVPCLLWWLSGPVSFLGFWVRPCLWISARLLCPSCLWTSHHPWSWPPIPCGLVASPTSTGSPTFRLLAWVIGSLPRTSQSSPLLSVTWHSPSILLNLTLRHPA